jgi:hypothetical protein
MDGFSDLKKIKSDRLLENAILVSESVGKKKVRGQNEGFRDFCDLASKGINRGPDLGLSKWCNLPRGHGQGREYILRCNGIHNPNKLRRSSLRKCDVSATLKMLPILLVYE